MICDICQKSGQQAPGTAGAADDGRLRSRRRVNRSLSPAKSAALRVTSGNPLATATAAMSKSAKRRRGLRPWATTAA